MKKWIVCLAFAICGCGGNNLVGTWKGSANGWDVTVKVNDQVSGTFEAVSGLISTNKANCFTNAPMSGTIAETTVELVSVGSGSASSSTGIQIQGEFDGDKITGFFAVSAHPDSGCAQERSAMTLTRQ
ncbi:hypothetical protein JRI60_51065 [Archangium violaceum]|uniref:hypothetical protein n=1 Tax=Archangium violaceum TaxID=83451 RepID=UPI001951FACC|nr:hypothetical protein [Archangium violaceum]QRN97199.1 hypothetical protein JRI60_51065 [Archangium violaceum]